jgi:hypothetical protein
MALQKVPEFREPGLTDFLNQVIQERERLDGQRLSKITANHSVLLQSPAGKVYEVKVNDAGVISATLVAG